MIDENPELTPLEESRLRTGRRYFQASAETYTGLYQAINDVKSYPSGSGSRATTERGIPEISSLAPDSEGNYSLSIEVWRISPDLEEMIGPYIDAGLLTEKVYPHE